MKVHATIINIPDGIKNNISNYFTFESPVTFNVGDLIRNYKSVYIKNNQIGNDIKCTYIVKKSIYDLTLDTTFNSCIYTIEVELDNNSIKLIEERIRINNHISSKNINFD